MKTDIKRVICTILALCMITAALAGCSSGNVGASNRNGVVRVAVVYIESYYPLIFDDYDNIVGVEEDPTQVNERLMALGSGTGIGKAGKETQYFVTNRHLMTDIADLDYDIYGNACYYTASVSRIYLLLDDFAISATNEIDTSRAVPCDLLYKSELDEPDLAVIKAAEPVAGRKALPLHDPNDPIDSGEEVWALGYPSATEDFVSDSYGFQNYYGSVERVTVTNGTVSLHSTTTDNNGARVRVIQHTASMNYGNSGGPLIDKHGAVVGINTWGTQSDGQNYFFSIEADFLPDILDDLHVEYDVYHDNTWLWIVIIAAGAAVLAGVVVLIVVLTKKDKGGKDKPADDPTVIIGAVRLQGTTGAFAGRRFAVNEGQYVRIGVDPGPNGLQFPDRTPGISRSHAAVTLSAGHLTVTDLGSTYGTYVNGQRIQPNVPTALHVGDVIALGSNNQSFTVSTKGGV